MLKNKKVNSKNEKETIIVKYNGIYKKLEIGKSVDVRDFDVANKDVLNVEKHLMSKFPGCFKQEKTKGDDSEVSRELEKKITELEEKVKEGEGVIGELREKNKELAQNVETSSSELQAETERANSLKKEADDAKAAMKDLEDEVEKLRLQISDNKK